MDDKDILSIIQSYLPLEILQLPVSKLWSRLYRQTPEYKFLQENKTLSLRKLFGKSCEIGNIKLVESFIKELMIGIGEWSVLLEAVMKISLNSL